MRKRFINLTLALGLVAGLFVGVFGSASADTPVFSGNEWVFFPWVPNGDTMDGAGPWYGTVTIQNLEDYAINIDYGPGAGGQSSAGPTTLEPHAAKTFSAEQLGVGSPGGGVWVKSSWYTDANAGIFPPACANGGADETTVTRGDSANGADQLPVGNVSSVTKVFTLANATANPPTTAHTYVAGTDYVYRNGSIDWSPSGAEPPAKATYYVDYTFYDCTRGPEIGAVEKHVMASPSGGPNLSKIVNGKTTSAHIAVDGYTGIPDEDVAWGPRSAFCHDVNAAYNPNPTTPTQNDCNSQGAYFLGLPLIPTFDGHQYLPITQTNNGWNSVIHITNIDASSPKAAAATITLYTAAGQGAFGPSVGEFTILLDKGESIAVDLKADLNIPDGWIGSAWITSDYGVVVNVNRQKPATKMALTNTGVPSRWATTSVNGQTCVPNPDPQNPTPICTTGPFPGLSTGSGATGGTSKFEMYAPLVFKNYNGWNMGFNIANTAEITNTVTVTYVGPTGNIVGTDSVSIPAKAMEIIYVPSQQDLGMGGNTDGFVGAAVFSATVPFAVAVDEVKYLGARAQGQGQAMSYIATSAGASCARPANAIIPLLSDPNGANYPPNLCSQKWDTVFGDTPVGSYPRLSLPLVQKGDGQGHGDTSGINLFNPSKNNGVTAWVQFFSPSGALAAPTLNSPYQIALGALNTATVYTPDLKEMSLYFQGSAQIVPVDGLGSIVGVSNNVNYDVQGDGSAVFNLLNSWGQFRFFCSQSNSFAVTECVRPG